MAVIVVATLLIAYGNHLGRPEEDATASPGMTDRVSQQTHDSL
jgi:hypothetical protein